MSKGPEYFNSFWHDVDHVKLRGEKSEVPVTLGKWGFKFSFFKMKEKKSCMSSISKSLA